MDITRRRVVCGLAATALYAALPPYVDAAEADSGLFLFGELPPPSAIRTLLSAGAPADPLLLALAPEKLPGLSFYELAQPGNDFLPEKLRKLPKTGRLTGHGSTLSLERLMALQPDLIVDCGMTGATFRSLAERIVARTGIPWLLLDGRLKGSARQLRQLGAILGQKKRAESQARLADRFL